MRRAIRRGLVTAGAGAGRWPGCGAGLAALLEHVEHAGDVAADSLTVQRVTGAATPSSTRAAQPRTPSNCRLTGAARC